MEHLRELITQLQFARVPLKQGEPMLRHTSFQIGGPAAVMAFPDEEAQIEDIFRLCGTYRIRPLILGAGTNILAPDEGLDTLIVETRTGLHDVYNLEDGRLEAQAGASMARLASVAMELGLTGLEFAHGIPGTVGGGVYMNAGAYGGEMKQVVTGVTVLYPDGRIQDLDADELDLAYRHSRFMEEDCVILRVRVRLAQSDRAAVRARMNELMVRRRESQPLEFPSAGSAFKRPETGYAAALIEQAGLKSLTVGGAQVSEKHAGFIINRGHAASRDVQELMRQVQARVYAQSGVRLEPEIRVWKENLLCGF